MILTLLMTCAALAAEPSEAPELHPTWGAGVVLQGIRPGVAVQRAIPISTRVQNGKRKTTQFAPTLSGHVHPGHYAPISGLAMLLQRSQSGSWFVESPVGIGATWVANARKTVRLDEGELKTVPLAGHLTGTARTGLSVGRTGERTEMLASLHVDVWAPWHHTFTLGWNATWMVRFGGKP